MKHSNLFIILFILVFALYSKSSISAEYWQSYQIWAGTYQIIQTTSKGTTQQALNDHVNSIGKCLISTTLSSDQPNSISYTLIYRNAGCSTGQNQITITFSPQSGSCPTSLPYEWSDGYCHSEPETEHCPSGQVDLGNGCENICQQGDEKKAAFECGTQPEFYQSDTFEGGSCKYQFTDVKSEDVYFGLDEKVFCDITWTGTGEYIEDVPSEGVIPESNLTDNQTKDTRQTKVEELQGDTTSETLPDGSTKTTENSTKTEIKEQGTVTWSDGQNLYIQTSDGAVTQYDLTTETITKPDGSIEKIIKNEWTYTAPEKTTITFNSQGPESNTSTAGQNDSGTIIKKEYYASNGTKTGEETTSTGGSSTDGDCTGVNCQDGDEGPAAGQPEFATGDGSWWESDYPEGLSGIWQSKQDALSQTAFTEWLDGWSFASTGSMPAWSVNMNMGIADFGSFQLEVPNYVWSFIGLCIIITSLFTARALIFGG